MRVVNRDGESVVIDFHAIKARLSALCTTPEERELDLDLIVVKTIAGIEDNITTSRLDELSAMICASMQSHHYAYDTLAGKILLSNLHKNVRRIVGADTRGTFSRKLLYIAERQNTLDDELVAFVRTHAERLDSVVDYTKDVMTYFSFRTLEKAYLLRVGDVVIESPQDMFMRVALAMWMPRAPGGDAEEAIENATHVYRQLADGLYTHATPTLFNAGTRHQQMSSCYLLGTDDSLAGIYKTLSDCATISKWAGGIGLHVTNVRSKGSLIRSTNGRSDGIVPMLKVFNETARYCNQSGRRKGSIAIYLEPWHADVLEFIELRRQTGAETVRARDLFLALWIPDEFMRRVVADEDWHIMSPDECPGLRDTWGAEFDALYARYVAEGRFTRTIRARSLWMGVLQSQVETGTPYIMFKDHVNRRCNQNNIGTIRSSNLCAEIIQYSDANTYAVCNLASIAVNRFYDAATGQYDHAGLHAVSAQITRNLNRVIDINFYPTPETRTSNKHMRPVGIGVQGFGDLYNLMGLRYGSEEAMRLDAHVLETIYHGSMSASIAIAKRDGPYPGIVGSMFERGVLQFDLYDDVQLSGRWDWDSVRRDLREFGCRNSMLTALMPTASTSQILGNSECFEPIQANIFKRTTLAGEFLVVNRHLMKVLMETGSWNDDVRRQLLQSDGSVAHMTPLGPLRDVFKTVWEVPQRAVIDHAAARAPFVDQSQSMNLFFATPNYQKLNSALIHAWNRGLKTGCYYMRSRPAAEATKVTVASPASSAKPDPTDDDAASVCRRDDAGCVTCSS